MKKQGGKVKKDKRLSNAKYTKEQFLQLPVEFRIGAIISDGMWYHFPKWKKMSNCTEEELTAWINKHTGLSYSRRLALSHTVSLYSLFSTGTTRTTWNFLDS